MKEVIGQLLYFGICFPWILAYMTSKWLVHGTVRHAFMRRVKAELRPFFIPAYMLYLALTWEERTELSSRIFALVVFALWMWWWAADEDDDDPWKKRGRKLRDKIRQLHLMPRPVASPA